MRAPARTVLGVVIAVLGICLTVLGARAAVWVGPAGEASFTATSLSTDAIVVGPQVLNSVSVPVRVRANRADGGVVWLAVGPSTDARSAVGRSAACTVSGVHLPGASLNLRASGSGRLADIRNADVWRISAEGPRAAELVVGQGRGPETVVVASGDAAAMKDVTFTLTWVDRAWFFEALVAAVIGAIITAFALGDLWHSRSTARRKHSAPTRTSKVTT